MAETGEASSSKNSTDYEGTRQLELREKVAFTILMVMSFSASLESTAIGIALPVTLFPLQLLFDQLNNC
jgi:hypothetical protein